MTTGGDSSANFREHDVEILQTRTKLWLEAILGQKCGDRSLGELIADGTLLYRVSKYIMRELTGASPGPQELSPKTISEVAASGKSSGKYLPYANVDTFLKTCRKVGLKDVELFTPPDVVEGKDIRRVCISIRSLAKKSRAQQLRVPDFEDVTRPMPGEKVGEIKENLEHHKSPVTSTVRTPEADIEKSERVQIISDFLSATKKQPSRESAGGVLAKTTSGDELVASSPGTPQQMRSHSLNLRSGTSPSTPSATIEGIASPALTKSFSAMDSSPGQVTSSGPETKHMEKTPSTATLSSDGEGISPFSKLGLHTYRHPQPHFSFRKSDQNELSENFDIPNFESKNPEAKSSEAPSETEAPKTPSLRAKASSSNKIVEKNSRSSSHKSGTPSRTHTRSVTKNTCAPPTNSKETSRKPDAKATPTRVNPRMWMPVVAGALAFLGTLLFIRARDKSVYEVKRGDTLSKISKKVGKTWDELILLNPSISNPHLIYPSERLKLPV